MAKQIGDVTVNDGKGLYDNEGLCDSILLDLNNLMKHIVSGQYFQFCSDVTTIAQKVVNLKDGIKKDMDSMKEKVDELKRMNDDLVEQNTGLPVDRS